MFLSKLFSIFKKKKEDQQDSGANKSAASPSGTVGAAVGISQPNQAVTPDVAKVAQGSTETDFPKPDISSASDSPALNQDPFTAPQDTQPVDEPKPVDAPQPQPPVEDPSPTPEIPPTPPAEDPANNIVPSGDDNQNITV